LTNWGVIAPTGGNGTISSYWISTGVAVYRVVHGCSIVYFDLTLSRDITVSDASLVSGLPSPTMNVYNRYLSSDGTKSIMLNVKSGGANLSADTGEAKRYSGMIIYPVK